MTKLIINDKKYDTETSECLLKKGFPTAMYRADGELTVYRSKNGNLYGTFKYWSNSFGPQTIEKFEGEKAVTYYLRQFASVEQ